MTVQTKVEEKEHSDLIGGSIARRRLHCPGSYRLSNQIPAAVRNKSSPYADEGTACHYVIEQILNSDDAVSPADWLDKVIDLPNMTATVKMTRDLIDSGVQPCIDLFDDLDERYADEGRLQYMVEARCQFPGVPGAFGTTDILAKTSQRTIIIDWKFGVGVRVKAKYEDSVNEQLLFYGTAARHTHPKMFGPHANWWVELYIAQPRSRDLEPGDPIYSHVTMMNSDLERFARRVQDALPKIKHKDATVSPGDWCNFCPAIPICPAKLNPSFEVMKLAALYNTDTKKLPPVVQPLDWGETYGNLLDFADIAEPLIKALREQAHDYMESGGAVPGWKLVHKRATEKYVDEKGAVRHVIGLGADKDEIFTEPELKSPAQLSTVLEPLMQAKTKKDRLAEARAELEAFTEKVSSGTTLAHDTDNRVEVASPPALMNKLAERLKLSVRG